MGTNATDQDANKAKDKKVNGQNFDDMNMGSYLKERLAKKNTPSSDDTSGVSQKKSLHDSQKTNPADSSSANSSGDSSDTGSPGADLSDPDSLKSKTSVLEPTLSTLVLSLSSAALIALGLATDPLADSAKGPKVDKPMAKFNIDMLIMLKEKTKGNLSSHEEKLMDAIVSDLQMKYVEINK